MMMCLRRMGQIAHNNTRRVTSSLSLKIEKCPGSLHMATSDKHRTNSPSLYTLTTVSNHISECPCRNYCSSPNPTISNKSSLLNPTKSTSADQSVASASRISSNHPTESQSSSITGHVNVNPLTPPVAKSRSSQDGHSHAHRDSTHHVGDADKTHPHLLKTNLDQALSLSGTAPDSLTSRRIDPSTVRQVYYFDTLAFTKKLEASGFTREQAEGCAECLVEIINSTLDHQGRHMVTKPQQEIAVQQLMSEIVSVKKDMTLLQKSEFSALKTETEKMSIELSQVQGHMNDEIVKLKGQFSLDINLERGRAIEAHAENEKKLQQLHNKIETEIANLKTIYEIYRNDIFKYAGGTVIAVGTLMLGVVRLWT